MPRIRAEHPHVHVHLHMCMHMCVMSTCHVHVNVHAHAHVTCACACACACACNVHLHMCMTCQHVMCMCMQRAHAHAHATCNVHMHMHCMPWRCGAARVHAYAHGLHVAVTSATAPRLTSVYVHAAAHLLTAAKALEPHRIIYEVRRPSHNYYCHTTTRLRTPPAHAHRPLP